jgi:hypothetical protein
VPCCILQGWSTLVKAPKFGKFMLDWMVDVAPHVYTCLMYIGCACVSMALWVSLLSAHTRLGSPAARRIHNNSAHGHDERSNGSRRGTLVVVLKPNPISSLILCAYFCMPAGSQGDRQGILQRRQGVVQFCEVVVESGLRCGQRLLHSV